MVKKRKSKSSEDETNGEKKRKETNHGDEANHQKSAVVSTDEDVEFYRSNLPKLDAEMKAAKQAWKADKGNADLKSAMKEAAKAWRVAQGVLKEQEAVENPKEVEEREAVNPKKLHVSNVSFKVTTDSVKEFFADCGTIFRVYWQQDKETKRFKGSGFLTFETEEGAAKALLKSGKKLDGRILAIKPAKPPKKWIDSSKQSETVGEQ